MSNKLIVAVIKSILLLAIASGTAWANGEIAPSRRIPRGQPVPIVQGNGASANLWLNCTWVTFSCTTGAFDAMLQLNKANSTVESNIATEDVNALFQNPAARAKQRLSLISPLPGGTQRSSANENRTNLMAVHTGAFLSAEEMMTLKTRLGKVEMGVFGSLQEYSGKMQGDGSGEFPKLGIWGFPTVRGVDDGPGGYRGGLRRHLRKQGSRPKTWRGL